MSKFVYLPTLFFAISCNLFQPLYVGGIWIPVTKDHGNFATYCISSDSSVVIITSTQKRVGDSIAFRAEPGFVVRKGTLKWTGKEFEIDARLIDPYFNEKKSSLEKIPVAATVFQYEMELVIGGERYKRALMYTEASKDSIYNIVSKVK
jgi:hypothetical protein